MTLNNREEILLGRKRINLQLPSRNEFIRFTGYCGGWVLVRVPIVICDITIYATKLIGSIATTFKRSYCNTILKTYDNLPYAFADDGIVETQAETINGDEPLKLVPITQRSEDAYHDLIIAQSRGGKTTTARYLALCEAQQIKVYDPHNKPDNWPNLNVIGGGRDFKSIAASMEEDLKDMQKRFELIARGESPGQNTVLICDEYIAIANSEEGKDIAPKWLSTLGREAGKVGLTLKVLIQDDQVASLGIEGQGSLRKCFRYIRLSKVAKAYARSLKNKNIIDWCDSQSRPCFIDDDPCALPDIPNELNRMQFQINRYLPATQHVETEEVYQNHPDPLLDIIIKRGQKTNDWISARDLQTYVSSFRDKNVDDIRLLFVQLENDGIGYTDGSVKFKWRLNKPSSK